MDIDDLFDELDDSPQFSENDYIIANQCIAIHVGDAYIGTGILINNSGLFLSVAHNFNQVSRGYTAYFDGDDYKIELVYAEYYVDSSKDFYIGRLKDFDVLQDRNVPFSPFSYTQDQHLKVCGFKSKRLCLNPIKDNIVVSDALTISQYIASVNLLSREDWLKVCPGRDLVPRAKDDICKYIDIDTKKFKGLSGGPIYSESGIHGLLVGDVFVPINYIGSILSRLGISHE